MNEKEVQVVDLFFLLFSRGFGFCLQVVATQDEHRIDQCGVLRPERLVAPGMLAASARHEHTDQQPRPYYETTEIIHDSLSTLPHAGQAPTAADACAVVRAVREKTIEIE